MKGHVNTSLFGDFGNIHHDEQYLTESLQPTTNGIHVNITYQLSVKLVYDTYCANQPECTIPLFIQAPPLQNFQIMQAPQDWNPQIYDQANFSCPVPQNELLPYDENLLEKQPLMQPDSNMNYPLAPAPVPQPGQYAPVPQPGQYAPVPQPGQYEHVYQPGQFEPVPQPGQFEPVPQPGQYAPVPQPGQYAPVPVPMPTQAQPNDQSWNV
jgi:hypothetical protein